MNLMKNIILIFIISLSLNVNLVLYSADDDDDLLPIDTPIQKTPSSRTSISQSLNKSNIPAPILEENTNENNNEINTETDNASANPILDQNNNVDTKPIEKIQEPEPIQNSSRLAREQSKAKDTEELNSFLTTYNFLNDLNIDSEDNFVLPGDPEKYIIFETPSKLIIIELYITEAPKTAEILKKLIREKFYDNTTFFRLIPNYIIQGGDPSDSGYGGYGRPRTAEINQNLKFERGTIAMSNLGNTESDDSQFFITFNTIPWLNGKYTIFGKVISGINYLEQIKGRYDNDGFLEAPILIKNAYVYSDYLAMKGMNNKLQTTPVKIDNAKTNEKANDKVTVIDTINKDKKAN